LTSQNECLGYLLYRTSGNKAAIVHLCANPAVRKQGVARKLVEHLKTETKHLLGIGLYCRRDYSVNDMWPRFGFVAVSSKPGRGHKPSQLTYWWFSHGHADLFSLAAQIDEKKQQVCIDLQQNPSPTLAAQIERALWPAKIIDADLPSFIVPIRPEWAEHFFDEELASSRLFGLRHDLHFGREAVYYRAKQISGLKFPGRILWYVSQGNEKTGSMSVKACSCLDEIVIGKPKDLYKQFRRLGIYEWRNVWELADKNLEKEIMAVRFSDTERFHTPVSLQELERLGVAGPIQSPRPITKEVFAKIYSMGYPITRH
jgi:hypothetical protein